MTLKRIVVSVTAIDADGNTHPVAHADDNLNANTNRTKLQEICSKAARLAASQIRLSLGPCNPENVRD